MYAAAAEIVPPSKSETIFVVALHKQGACKSSTTANIKQRISVENVCSIFSLTKGYFIAAIIASSEGAISIQKACLTFFFFFLPMGIIRLKKFLPHFYGCFE